ncbi:MAG: alpha-amylase [Spirochaetaceae bacterium]|jgi:glycosidase|nr:alpha-amylase [Spirochaetaceae bacterium]
MQYLAIRLSRFEKSDAPSEPTGSRAAARRGAVMEFHIRREVRVRHGLEQTLFSLTGNVVLTNFRDVRDLTAKLNAPEERREHPVRAGELNAMGLIDEILHYIVALYREQVQPDLFESALSRLAERVGEEKTGGLLGAFCALFPPRPVYAGEASVESYLGGSDHGETCRALALEELLLLALANLNPAFRPFRFLFNDGDLAEATAYESAIQELKTFLAELPPFGPEGMNLWDILRAPALASPDSLEGQLAYMRSRWGLVLERFIGRLLMGIDVIKEENKPSFFGPGPSEAYTYGTLVHEYERFSPDQDWMPRTVLMAKCTLVWLFQLSRKYGRTISRLDEIPDEELDELSRRGFTGLWLIGLWERSGASRTIKQWTGNPEAAASAYSLYDYDIASELGGWDALARLRDRCLGRGIRLGSDMVPNHTGIDSRWIVEHPDRFLQLPYPPFPSYTYRCDNLSGRDDITVQIEDRYFTRDDAAVVFKRVDNRTGEARYIYHGNDGTSMPWNDTAQIDFLNPEAREAVIRTIVGVCRQFPIVRFDAAMTLAKRHVQRLWYPEPGQGGAIASRAEQAVTRDEFERRIPHEFWREVVDRCAAEAPDTLLLAEAFWMMEGYFVRTLGMHRVYNSAFMNMLKNEENAKYRATIKNTLEFDPEVLKRFVNFLNNPDEDTAVAQFGKGDKYFGICALLVTMPGLPMFGHGQIEGFEEKYGMEYRRAYRDETPDREFVERHEREIFPLMRRRTVFSGSSGFCLYDLYCHDGSINENVFAYSNRQGGERALVFYNNSYHQSAGWINPGAASIPQKDGGARRDTLGQALALTHELTSFTLLREHRSNLWFIRSSAALCEQGFFVSLNGYEAQVFLDIHEVRDEKGHWARLCRVLDGRGTRDIYGALQDLALDELYAAFGDLLKPELAAAPAEKGPEGEGEGGADDAEAARAVRFVETAARYAGGAGGAYAPFPREEARTAPCKERIGALFTGYLRRLRVFPAEARTALKKARLKAAPDALKTETETETNRVLVTGALGYGALSLLREVFGKSGTGAEAAALMDHWQLGRKLAEALRDAGAGAEQAAEIAELARAVLCRTAPAATAAPVSTNPAENLVLENYHAEDFRRILRVNRFEGCLWFHKESFDRSLVYAPLFASLERPGAFKALKEKGPRNTEADYKSASQWRKRLNEIGTLVVAFKDAEALSEYRLDGLLTALTR